MANGAGYPEIWSSKRKIVWTIVVAVIACALLGITVSNIIFIWDAISP
jgi:hypothetical protein